jgi:hypothetical protein
VTHPVPRPLRGLGLLVAAVATAAALWVAASPPATSTVAPGSATQSRATLP